jgi:hypothetical protein
MKKILGIMLGICIVIGSAYMSYMLGSKIIADYYLYGTLGVVISFIVGVILFSIVIAIVSIILRKINIKIT